MKRKNFTIIELLVVITIITILSGMLLPALNKAREKARAIGCINNENQMGKAVAMYQNDYQGYFVYAHVTATDPQPLLYLIAGDSSNKAPLPYSVIKCPGSVNIITDPGVINSFPGLAVGMGYVFNLKLSGRNDIPYPMTNKKLKHPSMDMVITDVDWGQPPYAPGVSWSQSFYPDWLTFAFTLGNLNYGRHLGRNGTLFADGHAAGVSIIEWKQTYLPDGTDRSPYPDSGYNYMNQ